MFKVNIKNQDNQFLFDCKFSSIELAEAFKQDHISKANNNFNYEIVEEADEVIPQSILDSDAARKYLNETDYVVLKIMEASIEGNQAEVNTLKAQYASILAERKIQRAKVI